MPVRIFQEPGCQAPPPGGRAGSWPRTGVRRHPAGGKPGTGHPGVPGSGRVPICPGRGVFQHGLRRFRRKGIHVPGERDCRSRSAKRSGTDGKTAPDAGHAVKLWSGSAEPQVGKESRFSERRSRSFCVIHERFVNDQRTSGSSGQPCAGPLRPAGCRTDCWDLPEKQRFRLRPPVPPDDKETGERNSVPPVRMERTSMPWRRQASLYSEKAGSGMTACLRFNARGKGVNGFYVIISKYEAAGRKPVMNRRQFSQIRRIRRRVGYCVFHGLPQC